MGFLSRFTPADVFYSLGSLCFLFGTLWNVAHR